MAISKRVKAKLEAVKAKLPEIRKWQLSVSDEHNTPNDFYATVLDENNKSILILQENEDYNQLSFLLKKSKYMKNIKDMKGLAQYIIDRGLVKMTDQEFELYKGKKKILPIEIQFNGK